MPKELIPRGRGTFEGDDVEVSHTPSVTIPSAPDVRISPHGVNQRSDWQLSVTLNFPNEKSSLLCGLSSEFFDHLFNFSLSVVKNTCSGW